MLHASNNQNPYRHMGIEPAHNLTDPQHILKLMFAGKSVLTFKSMKTGKHYTFKIRKSPKSFNDDRIFFVSVLRGAENTSDYSYVGMMNRDTKCLIHTRKSRYTTDSTVWKAFEYVFNNLCKGHVSSVEIYHECSCAKCGRPLTTPTSIKLGIGPKCLSSISIR